VAARVAKLPKVFSVDVSRSFPSTVEITIVERTPVAGVSTAEGVHLVDATGLDYEVVKQRPPGIPELAVSTARPGDPATRAAVAVLTAIPQQLRAQVAQVIAKTPGDVRLILADEREVRWGSAENSQRKAAVLAALLTRPGKTYDVATPDFPTVS
jgi:cell division protein FtsQ